MPVNATSQTTCPLLQLFANPPGEAHCSPAVGRNVASSTWTVHARKPLKKSLNSTTGAKKAYRIERFQVEIPTLSDHHHSKAPMLFAEDSRVRVYCLAGRTLD